MSCPGHRRPLHQLRPQQACPLRPQNLFLGVPAPPPRHWPRATWSSCQAEELVWPVFRPARRSTCQAGASLLAWPSSCPAGASPPAPPSSCRAGASPPRAGRRLGTAGRGAACSMALGTETVAGQPGAAAVVRLQRASSLELLQCRFASSTSTLIRTDRPPRPPRHGSKQLAAQAPLPQPWTLRWIVVAAAPVQALLPHPLTLQHPSRAQRPARAWWQKLRVHQRLPRKRGRHHWTCHRLCRQRRPRRHRPPRLCRRPRRHCPPMSARLCRPPWRPTSTRLCRSPLRHRPPMSAQLCRRPWRHRLAMSARLCERPN